MLLTRILMQERKQAESSRFYSKKNVSRGVVCLPRVYPMNHCHLSRTRRPEWKGMQRGTPVTKFNSPSEFCTTLSRFLVPMSSGKNTHPQAHIIITITIVVIHVSSPNKCHAQMMQCALSHVVRWGFVDTHHVNTLIRGRKQLERKSV
jgi:hypothetical protein